jgi:hypothetical protein
MLVLAVAGLVAGCSSTSNSGSVSYMDEYRGERFDTTTDSPLESSSMPGAQVWLNASRVSQKYGVVLFYLDVHVECPSTWLAIEPGQSLVLVIDNDEIRFDGGGSSQMRKTDKKSGKFIESALYLSNASDIRKIAGAKEVKVKVIGKSGVLQSTFGPSNFSVYKKFVADFLDKQD